MKAPDFSLKDQDGNAHNLKDYAGKWLVLYFYLKDDTPGCTTQACDIRDQREAITKHGGVEVVGISKDSVESHKTFAKNHDLNFTILSDPDHEVIEAYGAWDEGSEMGTKRNTVIIDPRGEIVKEYKDVDPGQHARTIIADLKELQKQDTVRE